jgi:methyl-accepting chemotaxis protein
MSDSQAYEEVTVSSNGVTVIKRFEEEEFPVPAIAFEFESAREESVTVTMSDTVPGGIEVEDLGFHPEYGSEHWTIDDDAITFERELEAEGSYTTVYGIRATGSDDVQQFLTEPAIESVDPPLPEGEQSDVGGVIPETDDDVVKDAIAGDGEIPGLEEQEGDDTDDEDVATLELNDPNESGSTATDDSGQTATTDGEATVSVGEESLTAALAAEIREKDVSGEDLKLLRRALDVAAEEDGGGSDRARIAQIQDDISDLRAYTSALEEFLDENGTGDEMIEEFTDQLESFDQRLQSVQSELGSNSEEVEEMSETVSAVDAEMDSLGEEVNEVSEALEEMDTAVDELDSSIEEIEQSVGDLEDQVTGGEVADRVEDLESQIDDLQAWQEQIKETFGG